MTSDGNGKLKLSAGNWIGLLTLVMLTIGAQVAITISTSSDVAAMAARVESNTKAIESATRTNTSAIRVNRENIRENRTDIKGLRRRQAP